MNREPTELELGGLLFGLWLLLLGMLAGCMALLGGCYDGHASDTDERAIAAAVEGWRLAGLPEPGDRCEIERVAVIRSRDLTDQREYCPHATERTAACLAYESFGLSRRAPVVVLRAGLEAEREPSGIIHELLHHLGWCTRLRPYGVDREHEDPRVWKGPSSAQGRAREVYERGPD